MCHHHSLTYMPATYSSPVQKALHALDQQIPSPDPLMHGGTSVETPGAPFKSCAMGDGPNPQDSLHKLSSDCAPEWGSRSRLVSLPAGATPGPSKALTITPTHVAVGGLVPAALTRHAPKTSHQIQSRNPRRPAEGTRGSIPQPTSSRRGWCTVTAEDSPQIERCFLYPQSKEDFQELRTSCSDTASEMPILVFLTTYFCHCYLLHLGALVKFSNSIACRKNNKSYVDTAGEGKVGRMERGAMKYICHPM